jgi:hypothetical protein
MTYWAFMVFLKKALELYAKSESEPYSANKAHLKQVNNRSWNKFKSKNMYPNVAYN